MSKKIGWIGTGIMGNSMCSNLQKAGHECFVYSRTKAKTANLVANGAVYCESPQQVAEAADIIFTIVSMPKDVEHVYFGDNGIFSANVKGKTLVDMTTNAPSLAKKIAEQGAQQKAFVLDAPVSGGDVGAKNGTLAIMIGGDELAFNEQKDLFEIMGKTVVYEGKAGNGQHTKMANQIAIAGAMIGACESLLYSYKAGLDLQLVLDAISGGAAGSWSLTNLAPRILKEDYEPGFIVEHFVKDMRIALEEADKMNLSLPGLALVKQLYAALIAQGGSRKGTQALMLALKQLNNL